MIICFRVCHFLFFRLGFRVYFLFLNEKKRLRQRSRAQKADFSLKKRRLRQHSNTNNAFFREKKGACGNVPGPKAHCFQKKRCLRQRTRTKNIFFTKKKAPAAALPDQKKHFFANRGLSNCLFKDICLLFWSLFGLFRALFLAPF